MGIKPILPGFKKAVISSNIGDLEWVRGTYPTPYGNIYAEHRRKNGKIVTDYSVPPGVEAEVINERERC